MPPNDEDLAKARRVGRGGLALSVAKLWFVVFGLVQQIAITRLLGLDAFGAIRGVLSPASITYNPLVTTGIQGLSRAVNAPDEARNPKAAYALHAGLGVVVAGAFWLLAPWLGGSVLQSPHLVRSLGIVAIVILLYGLYAPLIGILNGHGRFIGQASLDMLAAVLRTIGLLVGGVLSLSLKDTSFAAVDGAMTGFAAATALILFAACWLLFGSRHGRASADHGREPEPARLGPFASVARQHAGFMAPLLVGQVLLNLLLQADTNTLRRFAAEAAARDGCATTSVDQIVGAYGAAQLFGFLPYQLLVGISFILFPMLARAQASGDRDAIASYVKTGMRLSLLVMAVVVAVTASEPEPLLVLVLGRAAALGAEAMGILVFGLAAFAIFATLTTVLNSLGKQWISLAVSALATALVLLLNGFLVRGTSFGGELLTRTALSTSVALVVAMVITALCVRNIAGAVVAMKTALRVLGGVALSVVVVRQLPEPHGAFVILYAIVAASICLGFLIASGELNSTDLAHLRAIGGRGTRR